MDGNPTTLIMLLSMAKLQQGQMPVGGYSKRWQTPEETYQQTHEAVKHLVKSGRMPDKIVLLYTDNLYLNNDSPAIGLLEKYQNLTLEHRRKTQKLFAQDKMKLPVAEMLWSELVQGQNDYQGPRTRLKQFYQNNAAFRAAVQHDNPKRKTADLSLTPANMFVLEETGLFDGLAKGQIASDKINPEHDLVIAYPGPALQSLEAIQQHHLQVFKTRPLRMLDRPNKTTWLDLSVKDQPVEKTIYQYMPHAEALKKSAARPVKKINILPSKPWRIAAGFVLPVLAAASYFLAQPKAEPLQPGPAVYQNETAASVSWYEGANQKVTLTFSKDASNQKPKDWSASRVQLGENDPGRILNCRDDMGYINDATEILAGKFHFKFTPYHY